VTGVVVSTPAKTTAVRTTSKATPKPTRKTTTKPKPRRTTPPPTPTVALSGRYTTGASWDRGFIGGVHVTNKSGSPHTWTVRLTFDPSAGVGVGNTWNAQLSRQGNTFVFTGGELPPGGRTSLGFEASKQVRGKIQPATCTVDGAPCRLG
jgi:cellulase/cellobiase CelA1